MARQTVTRIVLWLRTRVVLAWLVALGVLAMHGTAGAEPMDMTGATHHGMAVTAMSTGTQNVEVAVADCADKTPMGHVPCLAVLPSNGPTPVAVFAVTRVYAWSTRPHVGALRRVLHRERAAPPDPVCTLCISRT